MSGGKCHDHPWHSMFRFPSCAASHPQPIISLHCFKTGPPAPEIAHCRISTINHCSWQQPARTSDYAPRLASVCLMKPCTVDRSFGWEETRVGRVCSDASGSGTTSVLDLSLPRAAAFASGNLAQCAHARQICASREAHAYEGRGLRVRRAERHTRAEG